MGKKRRKIEEKTAAAQSAVTVAEPFETPAAVLSFLEKHARAIAILAVLVASVRIAATYSVFSQTSDEPVHIACGLEWLDQGRYTGEAQHPPLSRVMTALGPYLMGAKSHWAGKTDFGRLAAEGTRILLSGNRYDLMLDLARAGILPFFWVGCWVVYAWGRRYGNGAVAALAVLLFSFTPTILAHAGLATTDMALTAFLGAAFLTLMMFVEEPTPRRAALFGVCGGLVILSKFSCLVFFPAAVAAAFLWYLASERPGRSELAKLAQDRWKGLALAAFVCFLVVWAGFRFSFGKVDFANISLPFPELYAGIHEVTAHNDLGHASFLLGQLNRTGWWYFFPVDLFFKTPVAILILLAVWGWLACKRDLEFRGWWLPLTFSAPILMVGMTSNINIGIRHILPVYVAMALMAAMATYRMLERAREKRWMAGAVAVLCLWLAASSLIAHPDYLAYFNEFAGDHPENIVADSDLDWGQDFKRLAKRLHELGLHKVQLLTYYAEPLDFLGIQAIISDKYDVMHPTPGWTAISISDWKITRLGLYERYPDRQIWPEVIPPTERIGRGMFLWYIPAENPAR